jgi:hypothetical protein
LSFDAEIDPTALANHLANCLRSVKASTVEILGNRVVFTGGIFRLVSNWNVLVPFGSGDLTIDADSRQVHYCVSFRELALLGTAMVGLATVFILASPNRLPLLFVPLMWLWLVGGNVALGIFRFKRFVGRALATAPHLTRQPAWTHSQQE